jgi:hypothetical protein
MGTNIAGLVLRLGPDRSSEFWGTVSSRGVITGTSNNGVTDWGSFQLQAAPIGGSAAYVRARRGDPSPQVGYLWSQGNDPNNFPNRWACLMPSNSTDLQWYSAATGDTVMQLSGTDGALRVFKPATFASATATRVVVQGGAAGGMLRVVPTATGGESSIGFYRTNDQSGGAAGDYWVAGHASWGVGPGSFSIGTPTRNACLSIAPSGQTTFSYPVNFTLPPTMGSRQVGTQPWVAGRFAGETVPGAITPRTSQGQHGFNLTRTSTIGEYAVSWSTPHPSGANYIYFAQAGGLHAFCFPTSATSMTIAFYTFQNSQQDPLLPAEATFMIL